MAVSYCLLFVWALGIICMMAVTTTIFRGMLPSPLATTTRRTFINLDHDRLVHGSNNRRMKKDETDNNVRVAAGAALRDANMSQIKKTSNNNNDAGALAFNSFVKPPSNYQYMLQQPFYIYEELVWMNATLNGQAILYLLQDGYTHKHADDLWFMAAALDHPLRTRDPSRARIFVVPSLLNQIVSRDHKYCWQGACDSTKLLTIIELFLEASPWFRKHQGADHILVATDWMAPQTIPRHRTLLQCHMIGMEHRHWNDENRFMMPSYYVGNPCPNVADKKTDFVLVAKLFHKPERHTFQSRRDICQWLVPQQYKQQQDDKDQEDNNNNFIVEVCGSGEQCPALAEARFGFHVRGDTYGANRLMDTILSETIPIFTLPEQYDILPDWIDWKAISVFANLSSTSSTFLQTINELIEDKELQAQKLATIRANRDLFEWRTGIPFDTYMYMLVWHLDNAAASASIGDGTTSLTPPPSSPYTVLQFPSDKPLHAFDKNFKRTWCGPWGGPATSCSSCPRMDGVPNGRMCQSMCRWCPNGSVEGIVTGREGEQCVPKTDRSIGQ